MSLKNCGLDVTTGGVKYRASTFIKMVLEAVLGFPNILQITKDRFNEHRRHKLNPSGSYTQTAVSEHFLRNSHMLPIPIKTLRYKRDYLTKAREAHLVHKAKTIEPLGINKHDEL